MLSRFDGGSSGRVPGLVPNKHGKRFNITWEYLPLGDGVTVMLPYDQHQDDLHLVPDEQAA